MSKANLRSGIVLFLAATASVYGVSFHSLGPVDIYATIPGSVFAMPVVSGDGSTVAGTGSAHGFTWTPAAGRLALPGYYDSFPTALSYNGSVVVGGSLESDGWRAASWSGGAKTPSYSGATYATAVSANGMTTIGNQGSSGVVKYTEHAVWPVTGLKYSRGASADGTVIAGQTYRTIPGPGEPPYPSYPTATIWNNGVLTSLGSLTTDDRASSYAWGVSPDGSVAFGYSSSSTMLGEAFRWTAADGMVGLGAPAGAGTSTSNTWMRASNYDGSILVGCMYYSTSSNGPDRAIVWDAQHGTRFLDEVLTTEYGIDLTGWQLRAASGMSWDGQTIVGYGINPQGVREGWVVNIPEPASLLLVAAGLAITCKRSRS